MSCVEKWWTANAEFSWFFVVRRNLPNFVIELIIDDKTGKGEGTYIAAAKIRFDSNDESNDATQIEIENFATYPARLLQVKRSVKNLP